MRNLNRTYPTVFKYILAVLLFGVALVVSTLVNQGIIKQYFPYLSCILLFAATWFLFKKEGKTLQELGLNFSRRNFLFLPLGLLIGALALFGATYFRALYLGETIELSASLNYATILLAFYYILPQVMTEELLFRGYLFKKTIEVSNVVMANIIFSILFMLIHVIDENVLNNKGMILMLAISIPVGHLLFATALLKSKTLFFPIGLHLGNNWATRHLISNTDSSDSIFYINNPTTFETWTPFIITIILFNGFFLLVTYLIWKGDSILNS